MHDGERTILVIDPSGEEARSLKELIEFMDAPAVCAATPANWQARLGDRRLAAIFVNQHLADDALKGLLDEVGSIDPNVPIVLVDGACHA